MEFVSINEDDINNNHGWQKVTYAKKQRKAPAKQQPAQPVKTLANGSSISTVDNVFTSIEKKSEERRKLIEAEQLANSALYDPVPVRSSKKKKNNYSDYDESDDDEVVVNGAVGNGVVEEKKTKPKKVKKPKVSLLEAGEKIDADDLNSFLSDVTASFETQQDIQLMRFADYFGRAFSSVSASQFPWVKLLRESPFSKLADIPDEVYETSLDWISNRSLESLGTFVLWALDNILADLASQLGSAKGSKKGAQKTSSKCQVGIFVALAMVLRKKPDALISVSSTIRENSKYQGQDKLPVIVWMVSQASHGDLAVGLYCWSHLILPIVGDKSGSNPQTRDLILQSVERILSAPKARTILLNGAVRKGERLMPPSALDLLLRVTFPSSSARVKATERFEAVYPLLKKVALTGSPGSKAMKQVSKQILTISLKASGEGITELSREASDIFIWCLTQNLECYKQWDNVYEANLETSILILKRLSEQWKELSLKQPSLDTLVETLTSFNKKNKKALKEGEISGGQQSVYKEAEKQCKVLLGRVAHGWGCFKGLGLALILVSVGLTLVPSTAFDSVDLTKLTEMFNN